jgi:hypothetical protein
MPKSVEEILEHLDELTDRFENWDDTRAVEVPPVEEFLRRAVRARIRAERDLLDAVIGARANGVPWSHIGELLGTSPQAAQQKYGRLVGGSTMREPRGA